MICPQPHIRLAPITSGLLLRNPRVLLGGSHQPTLLLSLIHILPVLASMLVLAILAVVQLVNLWRRAPQVTLTQAHVE